MPITIIYRILKFRIIGHLFNKNILQRYTELDSKLFYAITYAYGNSSGNNIDKYIDNNDVCNNNKYNNSNNSINNYCESNNINNDYNYNWTLLLLIYSFNL